MILYQNCRDISQDLVSHFEWHHLIQQHWYGIIRIHWNVEKICRTLRSALFLQVTYHSEVPLQRRHNGHDGVSNHLHLDCLLNPFVQAQIKENIKAPRHWPSVWREFTGHRRKVPVTRKIFPFDDVIMLDHLWSQWWPMSVPVSKPRLLLMTDISGTCIRIKVWISNYNHAKQWDVITHLCP